MLELLEEGETLIIIRDKIGFLIKIEKRTSVNKLGVQGALSIQVYSEEIVKQMVIRMLYELRTEGG